jgi:hypothetical protein
LPGGATKQLNNLSRTDALSARAERAPMDTNKTGVDTKPAQAVEPTYETTKGCLIFVLIGIVLIGLTAGVIVLFGTPATTVSML